MEVVGGAAQCAGILVLMAPDIATQTTLVDRVLILASRATCNHWTVCHNLTCRCSGRVINTDTAVFTSRVLITRLLSGSFAGEDGLTMSILSFFPARRTGPYSPPTFLRAGFRAFSRARSPRPLPPRSHDFELNYQVISLSFLSRCLVHARSLRDWHS